jgi:chromate transporter
LDNSTDFTNITTSVIASDVPSEPLGRLFLRFLRFGALAWGGPVTQIAMIRQELVEEEKWVTREHFNRVLAVYQVLPGPEAHELCVYFGMLSRGRIGGMLAGLGFMLPGFVLMFFLSWIYVRFGLKTDGSAAVVFTAVQAAVAALIVRAIHRIGSHVVTDRWLCLIALLSVSAQLAGIHFAFILLAAGAVYLAVGTKRIQWAALLGGAFIVTLGAWIYFAGSETRGVGTRTGQEPSLQRPSLTTLYLSGLKAGLLTFGGAYTVIPFLQRDAVTVGGWMTNDQFLDGMALSGLLPAPLIIFATFVGYIGANAAGAILVTIGIFLPAFAFTLLAHHSLERLVHKRRMKLFLDGLTAGVVGLIAGTTITLLRASIVNWQTALIFLVALTALFYSKSRLVVPLVIAIAALLGWFAATVA